jgi:hypothetical protein
VQHEQPQQQGDDGAHDGQSGERCRPLDRNSEEEHETLHEPCEVGGGCARTDQQRARAEAPPVTSAGIATFPVGTPFTGWPWPTAGPAI